jgi:hypothetical protein
MMDISPHLRDNNASFNNMGTPHLRELRVGSDRRVLP